MSPTPRDSFETLAVHAGVEPDPATGAVVAPIQMSTTFKQDAVGQARGGYEYSRSGNPTRTALEEAIAALENAAHGFAYASGLAATQNLLYLVEPGQRILLSDDVYGGTWRLADKVWRRYGVAAEPVDLTDRDAVASALSADAGQARGPVAMLWIETPTNPTLKIVDIGALAELARETGALTVVDNTFATPYLQRPLELGADVVLHSATKYLGGHSDVVGGLVATNRDDLAEPLRFHQNAAGAVPSPFDCWLVLRGIRTLAVRMDRACENARAVAYWLDGRPEVRRVHYPGLHGHPQRDLCAAQMRLPGAMVSFELDADDDATHRFVACTRLFTLAESLGAVESLIELPHAMTHASVAESPLAVPSGLVRLSVGIESADDLIADLEAAFAGAGISRS
jgi:cystathionine gamma-synthase